MSLEIKSDSTNIKLVCLSGDVYEIKGFRIDKGGFCITLEKGSAVVPNIILIKHEDVERIVQAMKFLMNNKSDIIAKTENGVRIYG